MIFNNFDKRFLSINPIDSISDLRIKPLKVTNYNKIFYNGEIFYDINNKTWKGFDGEKIINLGGGSIDIFSPFTIWEDKTKISGLRFEFGSEFTWTIESIYPSYMEIVGISSLIIKLSNTDYFTEFDFISGKFRFSYYNLSKYIEFNALSNRFVIKGSLSSSILLNTNFNNAIIENNSSTLIFRPYSGNIDILLNPSSEIKIKPFSSNDGLIKIYDYDNNLYGEIRFSRDNKRLEISSANSIKINSPMILPIWTNNTRPLSPSIGTIGYNTDLNQVEYWNGTSWIAL